MIELGEVAATQLYSMLRAEGLSDHGLRIFVQGGGCAGMQYALTYEDQARQDDVVLDVHDVRLYIDPFSARFLKGASIHYVDTPSGSGFRVSNPNVAASCACGNSFRAEADGPSQTACCSDQPA
jgi:iron-sulfur cluster assembly accessory protein